VNDKAAEVVVERTVNANDEDVKAAAEKGVELGMVDEAMATVKKLVAQGNEKEAAELLAVLEWVAAGEEGVPTKEVAPVQVTEKKQGPIYTVKKEFTPAQALQIEEATALAAQMRANGLHENADEIEAMLKEVVPAGVTEDTRTAQLKEARLFAEKLKECGKETAAKEIFDFIDQMEMHCTLDAMSSSKELKQNVEQVMEKLDGQLQMIGEYTLMVEDMVPASKAEIKGTEDFGEVVTFLTQYVGIIERQLTLGKCWVQKLQKKEQAIYSKKLQDGQDTVQMMLMMMNQFSSFQEAVEASTKRADAVESLEKQLDSQ